MKRSKNPDSKESRWIQATRESVSYALSEVEWFPMFGCARIHNAFGLGGTLLVYRREQFESYFFDLAMAAYCLASLDDVGEIINDYDESELVMDELAAYRNRLELALPVGGNCDGYPL